ncbi:hypothetical protein MA785_000779 [Vibrio parahaemolyticus]|nr:hypothetical protein [Vibrio parahaemolyticus]EJR2787888.1 hypothetical protein [Vibrio parahaemolyticus]
MDIKINDIVSATIKNAELHNKLTEERRLVETTKIDVEFEFHLTNNTYHYELTYVDNKISLEDTDFLIVEFVLRDELEGYESEEGDIEIEANLLKEEIEFALTNDYESICNRFMMNTAILSEDNKAIRVSDSYLQTQYYLMSKGIVRWSIDCVNAREIIPLSEKYVSLTEIEESTYLDESYIEENKDLIFEEWTNQFSKYANAMINKFSKITPNYQKTV